MLANKVAPNLQTSNQANLLKLARLISLLAIFQLSQNLCNGQLPANKPNGTNKTVSVLRDGSRPDSGLGQALESLLRPRRSLPIQEDEEIGATSTHHNQLETFEGLVIPESSDWMKDGSYEAAESAHQPFLDNLYGAPEQQHPPPNYFGPVYYSMPTSDPSEVYQQQQQAMANLVDGSEMTSSPLVGVDEPPHLDLPRKMNNRRHLQRPAVEEPESFDHLAKDNILAEDMGTHHSYEPTRMGNQVSSAQSSNHQPISKIAELRLGQDHVVPIHSADLNAAAGHYYGKKKHLSFVKKKVYLVKAKKKKVIIVKKVKKKKKKNHHYHHHGGQQHHHGHGKYYMYAKVPKKKSWETGHKRGNKKHWVERHEKGHKNKFKTEVKWYDAKGKGKGHHIWDYNHHDKKKKKYHG